MLSDHKNDDTFEICHHVSSLHDVARHDFTANAKEAWAAIKANDKNLDALGERRINSMLPTRRISRGSKSGIEARRIYTVVQEYVGSRSELVLGLHASPRSPRRPTADARVGSSDGPSGGALLLHRSAAEPHCSVAKDDPRGQPIRAKSAAEGQSDRCRTAKSSR